MPKNWVLAIGAKKDPQNSTHILQNPKLSPNFPHLPPTHPPTHPIRSCPQKRVQSPCCALQPILQGRTAAGTRLGFRERPASRDASRLGEPRRTRKKGGGEAIREGRRERERELFSNDRAGWTKRDPDRPGTVDLQALGHTGIKIESGSIRSLGSKCTRCVHPPKRFRWNVSWALAFTCSLACETQICCPAPQLGTFRIQIKEIRGLSTLRPSLVGWRPLVLATRSYE